MKKQLLLIVSACMATLLSCTKNSEDAASVSDVSLSTMATSTDGLILMRTARPGEGGEWKIKMNAIASKAYSEGCKFFPANSMVVKEKHDAGGNITGYDVMYKTPGDVHASDGWLWSQLDSDGSVIYNTNENGVACQNCHATRGRNSLH